MYTAQPCISEPPFSRWGESVPFWQKDSLLSSCRTRVDAAWIRFCCCWFHMCPCARCAFLRIDAQWCCRAGASRLLGWRPQAAQRPRSPRGLRGSCFFFGHPLRIAPAGIFLRCAFRILFEPVSRCCSGRVAEVATAAQLSVEDAAPVRLGHLWPLARHLRQPGPCARRALFHLWPAAAVLVAMWCRSAAAAHVVAESRGWRVQ